jgi:hypothetical protein
MRDSLFRSSAAAAHVGAALDVHDTDRPFFLYAEETPREDNVPDTMKCRALVIRDGRQEVCGCYTRLNKFFCFVHNEQRRFLRRQKRYAENLRRDSVSMEDKLLATHKIISYREMLRSLFNDNEEGHIDAVSFEMNLYDAFLQVSLHEPRQSPPPELSHATTAETETTEESTVSNEREPRQSPPPVSNEQKKEIEKELDNLYTQIQNKKESGRHILADFESKMPNNHLLVTILCDPDSDVDMLTFHYRESHSKGDFVTSWMSPTLNFPMSALVKTVMNFKKITCPFGPIGEVNNDDGFMRLMKLRVEGHPPLENAQAICLFRVDRKQTDIDADCQLTTPLDKKMQLNLTIAHDYHCTYNSIYALYKTVKPEVSQHSKSKFNRISWKDNFPKMFTPRGFIHNPVQAEINIKEMATELYRLRKTSTQRTTDDGHDR